MGGLVDSVPVGGARVDMALEVGTVTMGVWHYRYTKVLGSCRLPVGAGGRERESVRWEMRLKRLLLLAWNYSN